MKDVHYDKVLKELKNKFKAVDKAKEEFENDKCKKCGNKIVEISRIPHICKNCVKEVLLPKGL